MTVKERIEKTYLVPVVVLENEANALDAANAMLAGGVDTMEITLRTKAGLASIKRVAEGCPDMLVGAGTVVSLEQCIHCIDAGAKFIVSPGYDDGIVQHCLKKGITVLPGCVTPTEIMRAINAGLDAVKFFPANVYGGIKAIKSLRGPFPQMQFVPTGGVDLANLHEYVNPAVLAVGGGWLCKSGSIKAEDFGSITDICRQSVEVVLQNR